MCFVVRFFETKIGLGILKGSKMELKETSTFLGGPAFCQTIHMKSWETWISKTPFIYIYILFLGETSFRTSWNQEEMTFLAILCDVFGCFCDPFEGLSDLQLNDQKVTLNHLDCSICQNTTCRWTHHDWNILITTPAKLHSDHFPEKKGNIFFFENGRSLRAAKTPNPDNMICASQAFHVDPCGKTFQTPQTAHDMEREKHVCSLKLGSPYGSGFHPSSQCIKHVENSWFWCFTSFPFKPLGYMTVYCVRKGRMLLLFFFLGCCCCCCSNKWPSTWELSCNLSYTFGSSKHVPKSSKHQLAKS